MSQRPLLLLAILLGGLLALKGLNLIDEAAGLISERAEAAVIAPEEDPPAEDEEEDAEDDLPPPPDPRAAARRELPSASRLGLERNLAVRRRELDQREDALDTREQLISVAEQGIDERILQLETLRDEVQSLLGQLDDQRQAQISAIVETFAGMEPEPAAEIFRALNASDPDTLLLVAEQLNSEQHRRKFVGIMAVLPPALAADITTNLRMRAETADERLEAEARRAVQSE